MNAAEITNHSFADGFAQKLNSGLIQQKVVRHQGDTSLICGFDKLLHRRH
ncbi:MAG: hypothetical protein R2688_10345 [Fimbriimonadaceae bacterium]